jgi:hypothetical protein
MRKGSVVKVLGEALSLYTGSASIEGQEFVVEYADHHIVEMRKLIKEDTVDWILIEAIPATIEPTGRILKDFKIEDANIFDLHGF